MSERDRQILERVRDHFIIVIMESEAMRSRLSRSSFNDLIEPVKTVEDQVIFLKHNVEEILKDSS